MYLLFYFSRKCDKYIKWFFSLNFLHKCESYIAEIIVLKNSSIF